MFAVEPLDLEHWMWSLFFGIGSLLWGQVLFWKFKKARIKLKITSFSNLNQGFNLYTEICREENSSHAFVLALQREKNER